MTAFYNEIDPYAAQWLRNLIAAGHIAPGVVDERSIEDIDPTELTRYTQCHFFAGIGVWSYALRRAGWPDDRQVWTGSCPCQPFSAAGKGNGFADERHLWPAFHWLISQCRPAIVFGEQVASKAGLDWFDLVQDDMEGEGYLTGAMDLCAAGVGAPHIRQRLYWVSERLDDADDARLEGLGLGHQTEGGRIGAPGSVAAASESGRLADTTRGGQREFGSEVESGEIRHADGSGDASGARPGPTNGQWSAADWLCCRDGKWRAVEPGTFPLAHGAPARVGRLRAYGNAIVAQVAQAFIEVCMN
jgi:DNA (cytosine-5)-methyltransferase 1